MNVEIHKILVVTDGALNFSIDGPLSLAPMLATLNQDNWGIPVGDVFHQFEIEPFLLKPRRSSNTRLDKILIEGGFSQLWLFGAEPYPPENSQSALFPEEIDGIETLMNKNRLGVFATGDHYDIGAPLCGEIPRVRFMRQWKPSKMSGGQTKHPPEEGGITSVRTHAAKLVIGGVKDEEDDFTPKQIWALSRELDQSNFSKEYAHRVCFHPDLKRISYLPDHMHEGICTTPQITDQNTPDHDQIKADFLDVSDCKIVAWAARQAISEFSQMQLSFHPVIGIFDRKNIGRIVVDSTFHHWIYKNIKGFQESSDQTLAWLNIRQYPRNIAAFLARIQEPDNPTAQLAMKLRTLSTISSALSRYRLTESFADFKKLGRELLESTSVLGLNRDTGLAQIIEKANALKLEQTGLRFFRGYALHKNTNEVDKEAQVAEAFLRVLQDR